MILNLTIFASIIPAIFNIIKNFTLNKIFKKEIKKTFKLKVTTSGVSTENYYWHEFQSLVRSINTLNCGIGKFRGEKDRKYSLDHRIDLKHKLRLTSKRRSSFHGTSHKFDL